MSEAKHTPGPWHWFPGKGSWQGSIEPDVCNFGDDTTYYPTEGTAPNEANARLIAAAPDLLEALEPFDDAARDRAADASEWKDGDTVAVWVTIGDLRKARAAIARAKGGAT